MQIAILKDGAVIDAAVFDDFETAQAFLAAGVWPDADAVQALPEGFGIGDLFDGLAWTKQTTEEQEAEDSKITKKKNKTGAK